MLNPVASPLTAPRLQRGAYAQLLEERRRQAEEDRIKKEEADKKKKEEAEKKKKEAEEKKKEAEEKKKAEAEEAEKKKSFEVKAKDAAWRAVDLALKPIEDMMDPVVGSTIDPFTDRRYIAWLSLVTLAFNYNTWFITARLCFPYHEESAVPYWFAADLLADLIYLADNVVFQPRKQFVKGGDIIVSPTRERPRAAVLSIRTADVSLFSLPERQSDDQDQLQRIGKIYGTMGL